MFNNPKSFLRKAFQDISNHQNAFPLKNHVNFQDSSGPKTLRKRTGVLTLIVCICIWVANKPNDKKISRNSKTYSLCFILSSGYNGYKKVRQPLTYPLLLVLGIWPSYICKTEIHVYILHTTAYLLILYLRPQGFIQTISSPSIRIKKHNPRLSFEAQFYQIII